MSSLRGLTRVLITLRCIRSDKLVSLFEGRQISSPVDHPNFVFGRFASRRSQVYGTKGLVSSSQPLATEAGLEILRKGGNAGVYSLQH